MTPWLAFLVTLSLIILVHEWGHFIMARRVGVRVERFSLGFGPRLLSVTRGGTEYALSLFPLGGYVKMAGEQAEEGPAKPWEYRAKSVGERSAIVLAGPLINYLLGFLLFVVVFLVGAPILTTEVGGVLEGYPAALGGIQKGDRILSVNDKRVGSWDEVTQAIHTQHDAITLRLEREGKSFTQVLHPQVKEVTNLLGFKIRIGMVGITPSEEVEIRRYPLGEACVKSAQRIWALTSITLQAIWRIATGGLAIKESITGPIGIFTITASVAQQGFLYLLQLIAVLSASLGLFNLLPVPVLDGGHLAFLFVEWAKGKPVSPRTQEMMTRVGLGLLTLLLVVVTYNDLSKLKILERIFPFSGKN